MVRLIHSDCGTRLRQHSGKMKMMPAIKLAFRNATMSESQEMMAGDASKEVRLGIKSLLAIMTPVAPSVTVIGLFVRQFPTDPQLRLSVHWGIIAAMLVAMCVYHGRKLYFGEKNT